MIERESINLQRLMELVCTVMDNKLSGERIAGILTEIIRDDCGQVNSVSYDGYGLYSIKELRY